MVTPQKSSKPTSSSAFESPISLKISTIEPLLLSAELLRRQGAIAEAMGVAAAAGEAGKQPLHFAVHNGHLAVAEHLVAAGGAEATAASLGPAVRTGSTSPRGKAGRC